MLKNYTAASTLILFILLHAWFAVAADQKLLEDITFETLSDDEERITFKLNGAYIPNIFAIKGETHRVVFDFPDIKPVRILNNIINTNGKFVKRIRMGIHHEPKPKTRVVFDLLPDKEVEFKHDFDPKNNTLIISVYLVGAEPDSRPEVRKEKAVPAQKPETEETLPAAEPKTPEDEKTSTITPSPSAPAPEKIEPQQPEAKLSDTLTAAQPEEKKTPETEAETVATLPASEAKTQEDEKTSAITPSPSTPAPEKTEPQQPEVKLSDTQTAAQPEEEQTQVPAKAPETDKSSSPLVLSSVTFDNSTNRGEMVLFKLNEFHTPIVFGVKEGLPRVVCDFKGAETAKDVPSIIKTDGKYVHTIRIGRENSPQKVRVVLDLISNKNYDLQQIFFKDDNLFVVIINTMGNMPTREELEKTIN